MKKFLCLALSLILLPVFAAAEEDFTARFVFDLIQAGDFPAVYALFDRTMQKALPEDQLRMVFSSLEASFGPVVSVGEEITSHAEQYRVASLPVHYEKAGVTLHVTWQEDRIAGLFYTMLDETPEELPERIVEESVQVGVPVLEGLLALPQDLKTPVPAVVLLHGSGPNDRDETIGNTKLFRDLAYGLAQRGIAALRYDKRTYAYADAYAKEDLTAFTVSEESIADAVAAARLLQADPRIDPERIYLIGHSMGAMIAPRIAQEHPGLFAGIILLSGTPKTLADIVLSQNQAIVDALPAVAKALGTIQMQGLNKEWKNVLNGTGEEAKKKTVFGQPAYYFWEMAQYDTGEILKSLDIPVLIINGGCDFQVIDADGIVAWNALALPENVQIVYHPELNHLLMNPEAPENVKGTVKEYDISCRVSDDILYEIAQFILD